MKQASSRGAAIRLDEGRGGRGKGNPPRRAAVQLGEGGEGRRGRKGKEGERKPTRAVIPLAHILAALMKGSSS